MTLKNDLLLPVAAAPPGSCSSPSPAPQLDMTIKPRVTLLPQDTASDETLIERIACLVNEIYQEAHGSIFQQGFQRTNANEIRAFIEAGEMVAAFMPRNSRVQPVKSQSDELKLIGVIRIQKLSASTGEFGMLALDASHRGSGFGTEMVKFAEEHCRSRGMQIMQTEALFPSYSDYAFKDRLQSWYQRMGYKLARVDDYAKHYPHLAKQLRGPADYRVFGKDLNQGAKHKNGVDEKMVGIGEPRIT